MTATTLADTLVGLQDLSLEDLRRAWVTRFRRPLPRFRSRDLLMRAFAHQLQVEVSGDLPAPLRRKAAELARCFEEDRQFTPAPGPALKPGCSLIREWRGIRHEVRVLEEGFSYQGEVLGSLSEAARRITGTKWNGHVFFGLKNRAAQKGRVSTDAG